MYLMCSLCYSMLYCFIACARPIRRHPTADAGGLLVKDRTLYIYIHT